MPKVFWKTGEGKAELAELCETMTNADLARHYNVTESAMCQRRKYHKLNAKPVDRSEAAKLAFSDNPKLTPEDRRWWFMQTNDLSTDCQQIIRGLWF